MRPEGLEGTAREAYHPGPRHARWRGRAKR